MASPLVAIGVTIGTPLLGWLVKHVVLDRLSEWVSKRKIAKLYKDSAPTALQSPPPAVFAPTPPSTAEQIELEHQRTKVKQVLLGAELEVAEDALHRLRTLLDDARRETVNARAEVVATRRLHDDLKDRYLVDVAATQKLNEELKARNLADGAAAQSRYDELKERFAELERASLKLKEEYENVIKEGETHAVTRNRPNALRPVGHPVAGRPLGGGLPAPPKLPYRRPADKDPGK